MLSVVTAADVLRISLRRVLEEVPQDTTLQIETVLVDNFDRSARNIRENLLFYDDSETLIVYIVVRKSYVFGSLVKSNYHTM